MPTRDKPGSPPVLDLPIDELESLLADKQRMRASTPGTEIPVLDDEVIVSAEPHGPAPVSTTADKLTPRQLADLGQRLQQRVDAELEDLADIIRGVVKRCLLEELRKELPLLPSRSPGSAEAAGPKKTDPI